MGGLATEPIEHLPLVGSNPAALQAVRGQCDAGAVAAATSRRRLR